ncbi:MAG TPA: AraC family transcriptional regulator [Polyangiaceae bacterium]|nr:AraC family transcriptional regulator [Polyangiaceae bacterium]
MTPRRRVDWPLLLGDDEPAPEIMAPPPVVDPLLAAFDELVAIEDGERLLKRTVELALERVGLVRAGLFLLGEGGNAMLGTWGTDLDGNLVDERHVMYALGDYDREVFRRAEEGIPFTVIENSPIVVQLESVTRVAGRGWLACTPVRSVRGNLGMLFNDAGASGDPVDDAKQARAALLCSLVGTVLDLRRGPADASTRPLGELAAPGKPMIVETVRRLAKEPYLSGRQLALELDISLSRLARVFKREMGMSLVEYRNRLRLERFQTLLDAGGENLHDAARRAGFGSYAQFHRVFRALRGGTPREALRTRGSAPQARRH